MSGKLTKEQIIEQAEIEAALKSIAKSAQPIIDTFKQIATEGKKISKSVGGVKNLKGIIDLSKQAGDAQKSLTKNTKEFNSIVKLGQQQLKEITDQQVVGAKKVADAEKSKTKAFKKDIAERVAAYKRVAAAEKKAAADRKRELAEWVVAAKAVAAREKKIAKDKEIADKKAAAAIKLKIAAQKTEKGSIQRLQAANAILMNRMKQLNVLIPAQRKQYARLTESINNNKKRIDALRQSNRNVSSTFGKLIKSVTGYALAYVGLTRVISFFTNTLFNLTKKLNALHFAMGAVISDANELVITQDFLSKTAINYGHDILTLTERYIKFRAAAQQSNLTANETMGIFDSMAKAAGVLGLKTDEVNGVFLALEQMISKGKVTTEELRRQLGERLPGAMGIMADSMGVTISQLDKMLKAGEVLSAEVLPAFAEAVERAYGIEAVTKIDNIVAAQGRMKTSWKQFVDELGAEDGYKAAINNWSNLINRFRIGLADLGVGADDMISKFLLLSGKTGDATRDLISDLDDIDFSELIKDLDEYTNSTINSLVAAGVSGKNAVRIWNEYIGIREAANAISGDKFIFSDTFDFKLAKQKLDSAEEDIESFGNLTKGALRDAFVIDSDVLSKGYESYKKYLNDMASSARTETETAKTALDSYEEAILKKGTLEAALAKATSISEKKKIRELYKNQKIENGVLLENYQNRLALEIDINNRLQELNKDKKGGTDNRLSLLKAQQALELAQLKLFHSQKILAFEGTEDELKQLQYDFAREVIVQQIEDTQEQKAIEGLSKKELLGIEKDYQEKKADMIELATDYLNGKYDADSKDRLQKEKDAMNERIAQIYYETNLLNVERQKRATHDLLESSRLQSKKKAINLKATVDILENEYAAQQQILEIEGLSLAERENALQRMADLEIALQQKVRNGIVDLEQTKRDEVQRTFAFVSDTANQGFDIQQQFSDNQLERAKNRYEREVQLAGDSEAAKLVALRKFEKEERKIAKRQAIAQKAQAVFNIGLSTAQAIIGIWAQVPKFDFGISAGVLTAVVAGIGAAQMAAALASPMPFFAEGTDNAPKTFVAGEKGSEAIIKPSGDVVLTPNKPTLFSDDSFVGSTILPHDETQKMLANYAVNQSYDVVDMSGTNKYLKRISDNTSNKHEVFNSNGKTIVRRGYVTSTVL